MYVYLKKMKCLNFPSFDFLFFQQKLEQTTWRGIPVNHFRSCQDTIFNGNFLIDYYFTSKPSVY